MATTWSSTGIRSVKAVCTTGSESAPAAPVKASQTVAFSSAAAGNTVTVRGMVFTAIAAGGTPANTREFAVGDGASADTDTGDNFAAAVNANTGALGLTASNASGTVTLTANDYGTYANTYTLAKSGDPITVGGSTLAGGVNPVGVNLADTAAVIPFIEATSGQTVVNGTLAAYLFNDESGSYARVPTLDVSVGSSATRSVAGSGVETIYKRGYLAYLPSGVTISSGSATVWHNAVGMDGEEI